MISRRRQQNSSGKGNLGMFIERQEKICAAGIPSTQSDQMVKDNLKYYSLSDTVDALIRDSIKPKSFNTVSHKSKIRDMRNAGIFSEGSLLINPPVKTKFQTLVEDFKNTAYNSYWNKETGKIPDPTPLLPQGFKIYENTVGDKTKRSDSLYEVIMPVDAIPVKKTPSKEPGYQINRNYCSFRANVTFGQKSDSDPLGKIKCCLSRANLGDVLNIPINEIQGRYQEATVAKLGTSLVPNNNIVCVPEGFSFGKLEPSSDNVRQCLRTCELNPFKEVLKQSLEHLNTLRKCLSKRFDGLFFNKFYLCLKYLDKSKHGWLDKEVVYRQCNIRYIRFNPAMIEPLLQIWNAFNGSEIDYKKFCRIINYRIPSLDLPKLQDIPFHLIDYRTTSGEIGNFETCSNTIPAGVPSGRYFDSDYPVTFKDYCKADEYYLPDETDMKACLCPSIFTLLGISHRDIYAKRDPQVVRRLYENIGKKIDDEKFQIIWENAKKSHSQEWVCYETFRRSLNEYENEHELT